MSKEEFTEFHRLLALIKYQYVDDLQNPNISDFYRDDITRYLEAIDLLMKICIIEHKENIPCINN